MPQLDMIMFFSQINFLFIFFLGYFLFLKYILPILSFEIKLKGLVELNYLKWFSVYKNNLIINPKIYLSLIRNLNIFFKYFLFLGNARTYVFGLWYNQDITYLRHSYRNKYDKRFM